MSRVMTEKPRKVEWEILTGDHGRLVAEPFERGYAQTVGQALRRTLLDVVPGAAVTWVRIAGWTPGAERIPGVTEPAADVLLNFKQLIVNVLADEPATLVRTLAGPRAVTGGDLSDALVEIENLEQHVLTLEPGATLALEAGIGTGRGYEAVDRRATPPGAVALEAAYSPVLRVSYDVEVLPRSRVADREKLVLEVWTNGVVSPADALKRAAEHLQAHFTRLAAPEAPLEDQPDHAGADALLREALLRDVDTLALAPRAVNALKAAELALVKDLVQKTPSELGAVRNLGEKSIEEIQSALASLGLSLGMRIDPGVLAAPGGGGVAR